MGLSRPEKNRITIFSDGAASGNPGPGGWGTIVVINDQVKELGGGEALTTNNRMEIQGALAGLQLSEKVGKPIEVLTDSRYLINGATKWVYGWSRNGWKTVDGDEVKNMDLWQKMLDVLSGLKGMVKWTKVPAHVGVPGNERADQIAVGYSKDEYTYLYDGPLSGYDVDLYAEFEEQSSSSSGFKSKSSAKAYYLSYVDGRLERHDSWAACENRVSGRRAKYKKVKSKAEEEKVLKDWGVR